MKISSTQIATLLKHFKKAKTISQREALIDYSIQSLTRRIADLRQLGYKVITETKLHPVTGQRYARYSLAR